jgi:ubiquitin carboxyl-terminal hydrolase 8
MRALKSAGMSVNTTKRFSRDLPKVPSTPPVSSPTTRLTDTGSPHPLRPPASTGATMQPSTSSPTFSPLPPHTPTFSPPELHTPIFSTASSSSHALVPTSALGPPSPTSSSMPSPSNGQFSLSEFSQTFPSIDELEEITGAHNGRVAPVDHVNGLPGALNALSLTSPSRPSAYALPQPLAAASSVSSMDDPIPSPSTASRQFPVHSPNHTGSSTSGLRRSTIASLQPSSMTVSDGSGASSSRATSPDSRPSSPRSAMRSPTSPTVPRKPSNLSLHSSSTSHHPIPVSYPHPGAAPTLPPSSVISSASGSVSTRQPPSVPSDKPDLPVMNSISPRQLQEYMENSALKVLLVDVRTREAFEKECIRHPHDALVCVDPSVLLRGQ